MKYNGSLQILSQSKAELGKLKNIGDGDFLLSRVASEDVCACGLEDTSEKLASQFCSQNAVNIFVSELSDVCVRRLVQLLSVKWRCNSVWSKLNNHAIWTICSVSIDLIKVTRAEEEVRHVFERNNYYLRSIVADPELWHFHPYYDYSNKRTVELKVCLAEKNDAEYSIFDGIHRAIQMAWCGDNEISLCVPE